MSTEMSHITDEPSEPLETLEMLDNLKKCKSKSVKSKFSIVRYMLLPGIVLDRAYQTVLQAHSRRLIWTMCQAMLLLTMLVNPCSSTHHTWETPGCHRVGHEREERIANCVVFNITLNVCRGFCESYAVPSPISTLRMNTNHLITSRAECCNMRKTSDKEVKVLCLEDSGEVVERRLIYKTAESCSCSICKG